MEAILATARSPRERDRRSMESLERADRRGFVDIALVPVAGCAPWERRWQKTPARGKMA